MQEILKILLVEDKANTENNLTLAESFVGIDNSPPIAFNVILFCNTFITDLRNKFDTDKNVTPDL